MNDMINPYIAGAPVTDTRMFFGREDVFDWIQNSLTGRYADHILVLHGQRRVGKTSVLKQLGNRLPEKYIPVFFDLQGRTHTTLDRFLWWLAREIVRVLKQDRNIAIPAPEKEVFVSDPEYFENHFLPEIRLAIGEHALLLTFDEFDNLEESEIKEELAIPLIDYLRRMMGQQGLNFIFSIGSSGRKLENMQAAYTEFFKTALYKKISFLSREQSFSLVTNPVEGLLEYDQSAVERIYDIASGHPYFTQLTCHELFSLCQRTGQLRIQESDVEAVLDDVVERGTVNLKFSWDKAVDIEKWALAALAQEKEALDNHALSESLRRQRVRFSEPDLTSGILHLREKDILTAENRFVIYLLKLWLKRNRPIEQVREELTETNPIANRFIEIGMEFQDAGQYDKAIENFRQALEVAPEHIQAQVNIALAYMAKKDLTQAVVEFERALVMDDEDVAARAGLCNAHLALGDTARAKGRLRDALQSYQKVLDINAEHTEARQRMAELARQRAEKELVEGRDEEALAAFSEALKFTPEDENLACRYEQAKIEKRTKVVASLLGKAEKEQSARNWENALTILQNALEIDPQNEKIQNKLAIIKDEQCKATLQVILARAGRAEQAGQWRLVAAALGEYLVLEPADAQVQARLEGARQNLAKAIQEDVRARVRTLLHQERFAEAMKTWEEYLKDNPAESQTVQDEIGQVKRAHALAENYNEAQSAFTIKNYDRAIHLFKEIIIQDENYRDASRRMAEAIELRRTARKWWQSRWLWFITVSLMVVVVVWFTLAPGSSLKRLLFAPSVVPIGRDVATRTVVPTRNEVATSTTMKTEGTTSISTGEIHAFGQIILDAISNLPPDYTDDFSNPNSGWPDGSTSNGDKWGYTDGAYSMVVTNLYRNPAGEPCLDLSPKGEPYSDFVLEFDAQLFSGTTGKWHLIFRDMQSSFQSSTDTIYLAEFTPDGSFFLGKQLPLNTVKIMQSSTIPSVVQSTGENRVTIIAQSTRMAVYVNGEPLVLVNDPTWQAGRLLLSFGACNEVGVNPPLEVRFDNLKLWNITSLSLSQSTSTNSYAQILAFSQPILDAIANLPPDYADDFSDPNSGWSNEKVINSSGTRERDYINGEYFLRAPLLPANQCCFSTAKPLPTFSDFVMTADFRFISGDGSSCIGSRWLYDSPALAWYSICFFMDGNYDIYRSYSYIGLTLAKGLASTYRTGLATNHLKMVARGSQMAFFLNDEPLQLINDDTVNSGAFGFWIESKTSTPLEVHFDNLKVWNITNLSP